ncbi:MAG: glycosyltransferase family 4 protein [Clostridiales bacterium]|nr:glycosyltransferase family 4 protein [Clostridiales bacterium]
MISYYFAPQNTMGAVRPTKLAKYLTRMGHDVTVICGAGMTDAKDPILLRDMQELKDVHAIREWNPLRDYKARKRAKVQSEPQSATTPEPAKAAASENAPKSFMGRIANVVYLYLWLLGDRSFQRKAKRELGKLNGSYDVVFSTYAPLSVHEVAYAAKKSGLAKRWFADFRDEVNVSFDWLKGYQRCYMQMIREHADSITAVSNGFLKLMNFDDVGRMLSNGYDREDLNTNQEKFPIEKRPYMQIVYTGQFQEGRRGVGGRDISPFFRVMRRLVDDGACTEDELQFVYAGPDGAVFGAFANEYGFDNCVVDHGLVARDQSLALQQSADLLMMATVNSKKQIGILTGKLYEYMMMDKPIVCLMRGDAENSELSQVLQQTGMGFCCEEAKGDADVQELYGYCEQLISRWKKNEPLLMHQNKGESEAVAYPSIAKTLSDWMDQ